MNLSPQRIKRLFSTASNFRHTKDFDTARLLAKQSVSLSKFVFHPGDRTISSSVLKTRLGIKEHYRLLTELENMERLISVAGAKLEASPDGSVMADIQGIKVQIHSPEQVAILCELFIGGIYNIHFPKKAVVFDIGMNVGIASLFFASKLGVEKVLSFEPFPETYAQAMRNLQLNPTLAERITSHPFGLSGADQEMDVEYSPQWRNNNGVFGVRDDLRGDGTKVQRIRLVNASVVIKKFANDNPGMPIVVKIDCEGSEYAIFETLGKEGLLKKICVFMMEWHVKGPTAFEETLTKNGFAVFSFKPLDKVVGMLYAVRL